MVKTIQNSLGFQTRTKNCFSSSKSSLSKSLSIRDTVSRSAQRVCGTGLRDGIELRYLRVLNHLSRRRASEVTAGRKQRIPNRQRGADSRAWDSGGPISARGASALAAPSRVWREVGVGSGLPTAARSVWLPLVKEIGRKGRSTKRFTSLPLGFTRVHVGRRPRPFVTGTIPGTRKLCCLWGVSFTFWAWRKLRIARTEGENKSSQLRLVLLWEKGEPRYVPKSKASARGFGHYSNEPRPLLVLQYT